MRSLYIQNYLDISNSSFRCCNVFAAVEARCNELQASLQLTGLDLVEWDLDIQSAGTPTSAGTLEVMEPET